MNNNFYILNPTLGVLCNDQKYRIHVFKGSSGECAMNFGDGNVARIIIKEKNRVHIDCVVSEEGLDILRHYKYVPDCRRQIYISYATLVRIVCSATVGFFVGYLLRQSF